MDNLELYNALREVPKEAKKPIPAGRLKGMTNIKPMWRLKALTEKFGPCGIGWKYSIVSQWLEPGADGVVSAFCNVLLQYKWNGEWSEPIPGTGGSAYVDKERNGLYTSDECYKKALTDAISVAAKAIGVGADVYFVEDVTKYDAPHIDENFTPYHSKEKIEKCADCGTEISGTTGRDGKLYSAGYVANSTKIKYGRPLCAACKKRIEDSRKRELELDALATSLKHEDAGDRL